MRAKGLALLSTLVGAAGLDNGFVKPALGWSSWYAAPYGSQVTDAFVRASAQALVGSGLAQKGYKYINVDEGWLKGRSANGTIFEDLGKFPDGMKALGDWIVSQPVGAGSDEKLVYGLYSCRGTCQCGTRKYHAVGSNGHEAADTQWMIDAGARWLKIDSCCGSQNHSVAFSDYSKFRDAMNKSGEQVWFNLCGWADWYAPPDPSLGFAGGQTLGNSYRISGDGGSWGAITKALNVMAAVMKYTHPGGYPDPDNILGPHGTVGRVTESQARVQMILWSLAPTQLILGEDVTKMSSEFIETVGNEELIAINQDTPFVAPARRIVGGDLTFPCGPPAPAPGATAEVTAEDCVSEQADANEKSSQLFYFNTTDSSLRLGSQPTEMVATGNCDFSINGNIVSLFAVGAGGTRCGGANLTHDANNRIVGAGGKCLDEYEFTTPRVDLWDCNGGANEQWAFGAYGATVGGFAAGTLRSVRSGKCLTASKEPASNTACENIWSRPLANGDVALAMVNQGTNATMVCDSACFIAASLDTAKRIKVRDMIAHADLPELSPPFSLKALVAGQGSAAAFRLTPLK